MTRAHLALIALLLAGCGSSPPPDPLDELQALVTASVDDAERRARMLKSIDAMRDVLARYDAQTRIVADELRSLASDHGATRPRFEAVYARAERERFATRKAYLDHLCALRDTATDEEWAGLYETQMRVHTERLVVEKTEGVR